MRSRFASTATAMALAAIFLAPIPAFADGAISGRVLDAASGAPIAADVRVWDAAGRSAGIARTDSAGRYLVAGLEPGAYTVGTRGAEPYVDELYDDVSCFRSVGPSTDCSALDGTPVAVEPSTTTTGIDLVLDLGGKVAGRVRSASTGEPIAGIHLSIWEADGGAVAFGRTGDDGRYVVGGLPTGPYVAIAVDDRSSRSWFGQVYDQLPCPWECTNLGGTPIDVTVSETTGGIDFDLVALGTLEGRVVDATSGAPIPDARIEVRSSSNITVGTYRTDDTGRYVTGGLEPGEYRLEARADDYIRTLYPDVPCLSDCAPADGEVVAVALESGANRADIAMALGGSLSGRVVSETGSSISARVDLYDRFGLPVDFANTDDDGSFRLGGLEPGEYFLAVGAFGHFREVWNDRPCPARGCQPTTGDPLGVELGQEIAELTVELAATCQPSPTAMCLDDGRFRVQATWRDVDGTSDLGGVRQITGDTGYLWFFDQNNVEIVVKVLDACFPPYHRYWVFAAGLTDVAVVLSVTDMLTGETRLYETVQSEPFQPILDTDAFATCVP